MPTSAELFNALTDAEIGRERVREFRDRRRNLGEPPNAWTDLLEWASIYDLPEEK
jgi:hypothetical protein